MDKFAVKNGKKMRCGYTTGSCATAVSAAAAQMLLTGDLIEKVTINLPNDEKASFLINNIKMEDDFVICSVTKDGGDDPDVTHGAEIFGKVRKNNQGTFEIKGGEGVGVVTMKGLQCEVGQPAINPVPKQMIKKNLKIVGERNQYQGGFSVEISVENGQDMAKKTYNPRLGIIGGISILGTTGIVEPMSEKALVDTIKVLIDKQYSIDPQCILISPGNYGEEFCRENLGLDINKAVQISNYVGEALDYIRYKGFKKILFVGHTGKLIKIAGGVMNTHSAYADCRMEIIAAYCGFYGANRTLIGNILNCITTDQAFDIIRKEEFYEDVLSTILDRVMYHLRFRLKNTADIEVVMFTTDKRNIIKSRNAEELINYFMEDKNK